MPVSGPLIMTDGLNVDAAAIHAAYPNNPVACYANGEWAWSKAQEAMFARKIRISVENTQAEAAAHARCIDVEHGDASPADVKPFLVHHRGLGFTNGTVYCAASNVRAIVEAAGNADLVPRWWIAWWWGRPGTPTVAQVAAQVRQDTGINLPEARIWACQYANHPQWDLSVVYGRPDFSR